MGSELTEAEGRMAVVKARKKEAHEVGRDSNITTAQRENVC